MNHTLRAAILNALLLTGGGVLHVEAAHAQSTTQAYRIAPGALDDALTQFASQNRLQLIYSADLVAGKRSKGLTGSHAPQEALRRLLDGSGLETQRVDGNTILLKKADAPPASKPERRTEATETTEEVVELETMVVTGTNIRNAGPIGSPLIVIGREEIESSGFGRVQDFLETLPQNFSGSASEDNNIGAGVANQTFGQAVDLRGLGASSTLVLINGRRQPQGGLQGSFVDISSIAASAVERIEVLTDGASAIYGGDAIGGVVNFVLRKDYEGLETNTRIATSDGHAGEVQVAVLGGHRWIGGNLLLGYEYSHREPLMAKDGSYASLGGDFRSLGGRDWRGEYSNPGTIRNSATGEEFAIPSGQDGRDLAVGDLTPGRNFRDTITGTAVLPEQTLHSAFFSTSHELTDRLEIFAEGRYGLRKMRRPGGGFPLAVSVPATNPYYVNPFGGTGPVSVYYDFREDLGLVVDKSKTETYTVTAGGRVQLNGEWKLDITAGYGQEQADWSIVNGAFPTRISACLPAAATPAQCPGAPLNFFGDGANNDPVTLDFIRLTQAGDADYSLKSFTTIAEGPLFRLPGGQVRLAAGVDFREEMLEAHQGAFFPGEGSSQPTTSLTVGSLGRDVKAAFGELVFPIIGAANDISGIHKLDVAIAARHEHYSDFGTTTNPKVGVSYVPLDGIRIRSTWGTSFRVPRFNELSPSINPAQAFSRNVFDPRSASGISTVIQVGGTDPDLQPETADTWTAGLDLTSLVIPGLSISGTYYSIDYKDKIAVGGDGSRTLLAEDLWASVIVRNPTAAQVSELCGSPSFIGACPANPAAIIYTRLENLSRARVRGVDLDLAYRKPMSFGSVSYRLGGSYMFDYDIAPSPTSPLVPRVDTVGFPLKLKLRGTLGLESDVWSAAVFVNYAGAYHDVVVERDVGSWTTFDVSVARRLEQGWLNDTTLRISAVNIFDQEPPFVDQAAGFDPANASQTGRAVSLSITKVW